MARRQQDGINEAAADAVRGAVGHMLRVLMENLETKSRTYKNKVCNASPLLQLSCALHIQNINTLRIVPGAAFSWRGDCSDIPEVQARNAHQAVAHSHSCPDGIWDSNTLHAI